jgi:hypothetical protein
LAKSAATGALGKGLSAAATTGGNALTAGYTPEQALTSAATAGLGSAVTTGLSAKPSDAVVNNLTAADGYTPIAYTPEGVVGAAGTQGVGLDGKPFTWGVSPEGLGTQTVNPTQQVFDPATSTYKAVPVAPVAPVEPSKGVLGGLSKYVLPGLLAYSALSSAPAAVKDVVPSLSTSQQEYFNRPSVTWNWNKLQQDAASSGEGLGQYISKNWSKVSGGDYNNPTTVAAARGGALTEIANYARGSGSGRDDTINAKLSNGEYVMDAETVALLGDGSSEEGARRLDAMRTNIREHKGRSLVKGKISPNAKAPLSYLKGVK